MLADHLGQLRLTGAGRDRGNGPAQDILEPPNCTIHTQLRDGVGPTVQVILPNRLAQCLGIIERIPQIIRDLKRLADPGTQLAPGFGLLSGGDGPHLRRRDEQRPGFRAMIGRQIDLRLAFPSLPGTDPVRHARLPRQRQHQFGATQRIMMRLTREHFEGQDDQAIAGQNRKGLRKGPVNRGLAAPHIRIVETRKIVMHKTCTMDQLQRGCSRIRKGGLVITAGHGHRHKDGGADPRTARRGGVIQRRRQLSGCNTPLPYGNGLGNGGVDTRVQTHSDGPLAEVVRIFRHQCVNHTGQFGPASQQFRDEVIQMCPQSSDPSDRIVIIGAGIAGLAAALRLSGFARETGREILVLERHATPGGKMRTLPSVAGPVDAGPTVLTMRHVFDELFAQADARLEDHVTLIPQDILARHWWPDGSSLDLHAQPEARAAAIRAFAGPKAEREFLNFSKRAAQLFAAFDAPMMQAAEPSLSSLTSHVMRKPSLIPVMAPQSTLAEVLHRQFSDRRLAQLFGRYATYVGGSPYRSPAILALIWQAEAAGVWCVKGGMHRLAAAIAELASARGVVLRYGADVSRIETQGGQISAVHLAGGERLAAGTIVFNGDPRALATGALGRATTEVATKTLQTARSLSAQVWSFAATPSGLDLAHHNVFFSANPRAEFDALDLGQLPRDPTLYICAEDRGQGVPLPAIERFEIIANAPPVNETQPTRTEDFAACQTLTFQTLARFGLTFDTLPGPAALTTPQGFNRLFPASTGSLYGQSPHGMMAAFQRPTARTQIKGLYLAGGGTHPGAGVPMATLSARHAAAAILSDLSSTSKSRRTAMRGGMSTA